jgi:hypothetical protein
MEVQQLSLAEQVQQFSELLDEAEDYSNQLWSRLHGDGPVLSDHALDQAHVALCAFTFQMELALGLE